MNFFPSSLQHFILSCKDKNLICQSKVINKAKPREAKVQKTSKDEPWNNINPKLSRHFIWQLLFVFINDNLFFPFNNWITFFSSLCKALPLPKHLTWLPYLLTLLSSIMIRLTCLKEKEKKKQVNVIKSKPDNHPFSTLKDSFLKLVIVRFLIYYQHLPLGIKLLHLIRSLPHPKFPLNTPYGIVHSRISHFQESKLSHPNKQLNKPFKLDDHLPQLQSMQTNLYLSIFN